MPTNEELLRENAALKAQLAAQPPVAPAVGTVAPPPIPAPVMPAPPFYVEASGPAAIPPRKTWQVPGPVPMPVPAPTAQLALTQQWLATRRGKSTPDELLGQIGQIKTVINSGVNSAGYGDKRTEFRSLAELQQILNGLEEDLGAALGYGGRIRQIRMTTQWDKGL
jgi:hypothetical protein